MRWAAARSGTTDDADPCLSCLSQIVESTAVESRLLAFLGGVPGKNAVPFGIVTTLAARAAGASRIRHQGRQRVIGWHVAKRAMDVRCCSQGVYLQAESTEANHAGGRGREKVRYVLSGY